MVIPLEKLRKARKDAGQTVAQFAADVGISKASLSKIERGLQRPRVELVAKLIKKTKLSASDLRPDLAELMRGEAAA